MESLFLSAKILPLNLLYFQTVSNLMYDISKKTAPENICKKFIRCSSIHLHHIRASTSEHFYIKYSRTNQLNNSIAIFGAKVWNCLPLGIRRLPRTAFQQKIRHLLFQIFDAEDSYVDSPTQLNKIAKQQS